MELNGIDIAVERKNIKNLHLAVYPPDAHVHVSSPNYLDDNDIRSFIISKKLMRNTNIIKGMNLKNIKKFIMIIII